MSNVVKLKRHVDPDIFKAFLKSKGLSIRQLETYCDVSERTIRRCLQQEEITLNIALELCRVFDVNFDEIFGPDTSDRWRESMVFLYKKIP